MTLVLVHATTPRNEWHVLRQAHPGGRITTLCAWACDYERANVSTPATLPRNTCRACRAELAAGTPGAATTRDLRRPSLAERRAVHGMAERSATLADNLDLVAWASDDAAHMMTGEAEWNESAIPELVMDEMTSRAVRR